MPAETEIHPLAETGWQTARRYVGLIVGDAVWIAEGVLALVLIVAFMVGLLVVGAK